MSAPCVAQPASPFDDPALLKRLAAQERERKLSFVLLGLLGLNEAVSWIRDATLTRHAGQALARAIDLLNEVRKETEQ